MRVGVIRGDLAGPVFVSDLEPTSQVNKPVDNVGQSTYISRPNVAQITAYLAAQGLAASASALITATVPVGGPLDCRSATIKAVAGLGGATNPQVLALQNMLTQQFVESDVLLKSYQVGGLSKLLSATFNPDPNRLPALTPGAAIAVVQDDGNTAFSAPIPQITGAVHNSPSAGDLTITGTGLGNAEAFNATVVRVTSPTTGAYVHLEQRLIAATLTGGTQGSVGPTSIVIPASLLAGLGVAGSLVQVKNQSLGNTNSGATATMASVTNGLVTLTGLARMTPNSVGQVLRISNAANAVNNGSFLVTSYVSATSVTITNLAAIPGDANNGSIHWVEPAPVVFIET